MIQYAVFSSLALTAFTTTLLQEPAAEPTTLTGTLVPAAADSLPIELWPESWSGEWLITEIAGHGTWVHEGQLLARFHPRALREAFERAETEFAAAQQDHRIAAARAGLEADVERERMDSATAALERAEAGYQSWRDFDVPLRLEQAALTDMYSQHGLEDQQAELAQLEAMYGADELTDATEELVLMRSRRNLARSRTQLDIARRQRAKTAELNWVHEEQEKEEAILRQRTAFERQRATAELDSAARRARLERSELELERKQRDLERLRHDLGLLELRAPREGLLLHGTITDFEPGNTPSRLARGDRAPVKKTVFTITGGKSYLVALEISESVRARGDSAVSVTWEGLQNISHGGRLEINSFPTPRSSGANESNYTAHVALGDLKGVTPGMRVKVQINP
ncbi:MAG: hypothetical protein O3A20_03605 [Planctomycetota bacterium]|nr:hypothetical protein [Planctomycetota bacterium]